MNIVFISYEYPPDTAFGGISTYVYNASRMLADAGHSVLVLTATDAATRTEHPSRSLTVHRVCSPDRLHFRDHLAAHAAPFFARNTPDIIESVDFMYEGVAVKARYPAIPFVVKLHTPNFLAEPLNHPPPSFTRRVRHRLGRWLRRLNPPKPTRAATPPPFSTEEEIRHLRSCPFLITPSLSLGGIVAQRTGHAKESILHVPYPQPEIPAYTHFAPRTGTDTITFVGRLERRKGVHLFPEVIPIVARHYPRIRFQFIGEDQASPLGGLTMKQYLLQRLPQHTANLEFLGRLKREELGRHYAAADLCVFPSLWGNFPGVCLEAMMAGRAILGSRHGGMADMLAEGCGHLIDPPKTKVWAHLILELLGKPDLRLEMARRARDRVLNAYSPSRILQLQVATYEQIIRAGTTSRPQP